MGRRLRIQHESFFYFITNRCFQARYLLAPDPAGVVNDLVNNCLKTALENNEGVKLYGGVVMSNHFHLIVKAPKLNLSTFMKDFQSKLAKGINAFRGRTGALFQKRFESDVIVGNQALLESLRYILMNPVKAGLVAHPSQWPGFMTCGAFREGCKHLEVSHLPLFSSMEQQRRLIVSAVNGIAGLLVKGKTVLGADGVMALCWRGRPVSPKRKKRSFYEKIFCRCKTRKKLVYEALCDGIASYYEASSGFGKRVRRMVRRQRRTFPVGFSLPILIFCWKL